MDIDRDLTMNDFPKAGVRVEMHPCTDWWMQGDRFGTVTKVDTVNSRLHVKLDKSKRTVIVPPDLIDPGTFNPNRFLC